MKEREQNRRSSMTSHRLALLQAIDFKGPSPKDVWEKRFEEMVAFRNKKGHCNVPTKWSQNRALGRWVSTQRREYKKYQVPEERSLLTAEKIARLESVGFQWDRSGVNQRSDDNDSDDPDIDAEAV